MTRFLTLLALCAAGPALAQSQFAQLETAHLPLTATDCRLGTAADFDGDGHLDLALSNIAQVRLFLSDGAGGFLDASARIPQSQASTIGLVAGDLDGDGDDDLVVSRSRAAPVLLLNRGSRFVEATLPTSASFESAALVDVDRDGDLDVWGEGPAGVVLLANQGNAAFVDVTDRLPSERAANEILPGDYDGDGDPDLVLIHSSNLVPNRLWTNDGTGRFRESAVPFDARTAIRGRSGDLDGDGDLDLLVQVFVPLLAPKVLLNDGAAGFRDALSRGLPSNTGYFELIDIDDDGDLDVLLQNADGVQIVLNDGTANFRPGPPDALPPFDGALLQAIAGDFDEDRDTDVFVGSEYGSRLWLQLAGASFGNGIGYAFPEPSFDARAMAFADLDLDGMPELAAVSIFGNVRVFRNDGTGRFAPIDLDLRPSRAVDLEFEDISGDGRPDLVVPSFSFADGRVRLFLSSGPFLQDRSELIAAAPSNSSYSAVADFDGDGRKDLVFSGGAEFRVLLQTEPLGFVPGSVLPFSSAGPVLLAEDFDGDGDVDLCTGRAVLRNDGRGGFAVVPNALPYVGYLTVTVASLDADGDGDLDLFLGRSSGIDGEQDLLVLNRGDGTFVDGTVGRLPLALNATTGVAAADTDGDGDTDLVVVDRERVLHLVNDGRGVFARRADGLLEGRSRTEFGTAVAIADVDGDLDLDVVTDERVFRSLHVQLDTPRLPLIGRAFRYDAWVRDPAGGGSATVVPFLGSHGYAVRIPGIEGTLRLRTYPFLPLPPLSTPAVGGKASGSIPVPLDGALLGVMFGVQGLALLHSGRAVFTNVTDERIQ